MNANLRYFEKMKKMHVFFLKSVVRWIERLQNIDKIINHSRTYEEVIDICLKLGSNIEFGEFHLIRTLSHYCSQNYFGNTLEKKIKPKVISLEMVSTGYLLYLREIMHNFVNKYESESLLDEYCLNKSQILSYYEMILSAKLQIACER